jgi:hypothetical protein
MQSIRKCRHISRELWPSIASDGVIVWEVVKVNGDKMSCGSVHWVQERTNGERWRSDIGYDRAIVVDAP